MLYMRALPLTCTTAHPRLQSHSYIETVRMRGICPPPVPDPNLSPNSNNCVYWFGRGTQRFDARSLRFQAIGQVVHTRVPPSPSSKFGTGQWAVLPCGWEGNRRSVVALAMRHRLQWFIHLRAQGPRKGDYGVGQNSPQLARNPTCKR